MATDNKAIVEKVNSAFAKNNYEGFLAECKNDVVWKMAGEETRKGVDTIRTFLKSMEGMEAPKFSVDNLIGDGELVACNGSMTMKNPEGKEESYDFCDIYRFEGGKIAELTSYVVKTGGQAESAKA
jgi:uncharacterized protein